MALYEIRSICPVGCWLQLVEKHFQLRPAHSRLPPTTISLAVVGAKHAPVCLLPWPLLLCICFQFKQLQFTQLFLGGARGGRVGATWRMSYQAIHYSQLHYFLLLLLAFIRFAFLFSLSNNCNLFLYLGIMLILLISHSLFLTVVHAKSN